MIKVGLPTVLVYGFDRLGEFNLVSTLYKEEGLQESVIFYGYESLNDFQLHFATHRPDVIVTIGGSRQDWSQLMDLANHRCIASKWCHYTSKPSAEKLANDSVTYATYWACGSFDRVFNVPDEPYFTVFTGAYKTGDRIWRTYEGVKNQTYPNWEWVVIDDSPEDHTETWQILQQIAKTDYRVRPYRMNPISGGNIGEVKNRACSMANGNWLIELDHDDYLLPELMETSVDAIKTYPDAGFLYTDVAEPYEDGEMRAYTQTIGPKEHWYANPNNTFVWSYGGHEWVDWNGTSYICHRYPEINPKTIRFNIGMPNHARIWKKEVYDRIGKHNRFISVTDDLELIIRTFLHTRMVHIKQMLYLQYNNRNSTVDNNVIDINRKARIIRDFYDEAIHNRIIELGGIDWEWDESLGQSGLFQGDCSRLKYFEEERYLNYTYEKTS